MKCFVAMAFGHEDTDKMFEKQILEVLSAKGINVVRVDRVEHNDNIDDRIFTEIRNADFLIADLTYARPSVYFEAGFAEREIAVIYTARRDHFGQKPDDKYGNFRIHFDVATRNIIDWVSPEDSLFAQRLLNRVEYVTAPILERTTNLDLVRERRRAFRALSRSERRSNTQKVANDVLKSLNYIDHEGLKAVGLQGAFTISYGEEDWYAAKASTYSVVRLRDLDGYGSLHPKIDQCEFNLNVTGNIGTFERIIENWVVPISEVADPEKMMYNSERFRWSTDLRIFSFEEYIEIPALENGFRGDVFLDCHRLPETLAQHLWGSGEIRKGFRTKTPPMGATHTRAPFHDGFRFVYAGFSSRTVRRQIVIHVVDNIVDSDEFAQRLLALLADR